MSIGLYLIEAYSAPVPYLFVALVFSVCLSLIVIVNRRVFDLSDRVERADLYNRASQREHIEILIKLKNQVITLEHQHAVILAYTNVCLDRCTDIQTKLAQFPDVVPPSLKRRNSL